MRLWTLPLMLFLGMFVLVQQFGLFPPDSSSAKIKLDLLYPVCAELDRDLGSEKHDSCYQVFQDCQ